MNEIEQRIRHGLDVEVPVSPDRMIGAAAAGARRQRQRRAAGLVAGATAAVVLAVVAGVALTGGGQRPDPPKPIETPRKVSNPPPANLWFHDLESDGSTLYLTTHPCAGTLLAGRCAPRGGYWNGRPPAAEEAHPVTLWRYADDRWERLGPPGADSFAEMVAVPGGLMFVPHDRENDPYTDGPVRISLDGGRTWETWVLPWKRGTCSGATDEWCRVVVSGDYVVAASGRTWARRHLRSAAWEDVSPPARPALYDFDKRGWHVLALDDGTLVATADNLLPGGKGVYRVSRDHGATWGELHDNPGQTAQGHGSFVDRSDGETVYAECWEIVPGYGGDSGRSCGYYRSTDLERWTKAAEPLARDPQICARPDGATWAMTVVAERVGGTVYEIASVPFVHGHAATHDDLPHLDVPHRVRRELELSADGCRTWEPVLD